jgi:hypothetical protein
MRNWDFFNLSLTTKIEFSAEKASDAGSVQSIIALLSKWSFHCLLQMSRNANIAIWTRRVIVAFARR